MESVPVRESLHIEWMNIARVPARVRVPCMLFHGEQDQVYEVNGSRRLYEKVRGGRVIDIVEGVGLALRIDRRRDHAYKTGVDWLTRHTETHNREG